MLVIDQFLWPWMWWGHNGTLDCHIHFVQCRNLQSSYVASMENLLYGMITLAIKCVNATTCSRKGRAMAANVIIYFGKQDNSVVANSPYTFTCKVTLLNTVAENFINIHVIIQTRHSWWYCNPQTQVQSTKRDLCTQFLK